MFEALVYGRIYPWTAEYFVQAIADAKPKDITVRVDSDGGYVRSGWAMISRFREVPGKKIAKNDSEAHSMAAWLFFYADEGEATDVAKFGLHRAGFQPEIEANLDLEDRNSLLEMNKHLRAALEAKCTPEKFYEVTKVTIDDLFSMSGRPYVTLNAEQAKEIGMIDRIANITPQKRAENRAKAEALYSGLKHQAAATQDNPTNHIMTSAELKQNHPAVYAEIFNEGRTAGVTAGKAEEQDRTKACLAFHDIDPKGAVEAVLSGKSLSQSDIAAFTVKAITASKKDELKNDSQKDDVTADPPKDGADPKAEKLKKLLESAEKNSKILNTKA